jgi:hypothetical protein
MRFPEFERNPEPRVVRRFSVAWLPAALAAGAFVAFRAGRPGWVPAACLVAAAASVAAGLARPEVMRPLFVGLSAATAPAGWVVSRAILLVAYYGVVTPVGLALRLRGRDPLTRSFDPSAASYWIRRRAPSDARRWFRQF